MRKEEKRSYIFGITAKRISRLILMDNFVLSIRKGFRKTHL